MFCSQEWDGFKKSTNLLCFFTSKSTQLAKKGTNLLCFLASKKGHNYQKRHKFVVFFASKRTQLSKKATICCVFLASKKPKRGNPDVRASCTRAASQATSRAPTPWRRLDPILNPLVPRGYKEIKIRQISFSWPLPFLFVKDILYRAGHFRYFLIVSKIKNDFLHFLAS